MRGGLWPVCANTDDYPGVSGALATATAGASALCVSECVVCSSYCCVDCHLLVLFLWCVVSRAWRVSVWHSTTPPPGPAAFLRPCQPHAVFSLLSRLSRQKNRFSSVLRATLHVFCNRLCVLPIALGSAAVRRVSTVCSLHGTVARPPCRRDSRAGVGLLGVAAVVVFGLCVWCVLPKPCPGTRWATAYVLLLLLPHYFFVVLASALVFVFVYPSPGIR